MFIYFIYFLKDFISSLERGEGREKEKEGNGDVWEKHPSVASCLSPSGGLAHHPGMCPDRELNQFAVQYPTHWAASVRAVYWF